MTASYQAADGSGTTAQTYWYKYDAMNRFVTTKGTLTGARGSGSITVGTGSVISYDAAGHRATVTDASSAEVYSYTADGYLAQVTIGGVLRAKYALDASGRALAYSEYNAAGTSVVYSRTAVYDAVSNVTSDSVTTVRTDGTYVAASTYSYGTPVYHAGTFSYSFDGAYQGVVSQIVTTNTKNGSAQPTSEADYFYDWRDSAVEGTESYTANTAVSAPVANYSGYNYGLGGRLASVVIDDGHPRTITFGTNIEGQILSRAENDNVGGTVDQYERHFYFDGMALGDVSNNGTSDTDYAASIAAHIAVPGSGNLRGGATVAMPYADFDQSYDPVNGITYAGAPSHYTAQDGDTLAGIAAMVWGDASLWYLIADANGLSSPSDSLTAGTDLILPNKVVNLHNNASTFKVYDPNEAIGDTAPTVPKQPKHDGNNCGVFGQILKAVVAIVVTVVTGGNAVLGDLAAQVFSLATGIQKSFNWNELAESGITAGVANGLQEVGMVVQTTSEIFNAVANAVITNVVSQGIEVATGLQKSFDWAGVAASGIGGGVGYAVGDWAGSQDFFDGNATLNQVATTVFASTARDIVSAAARTLINGSDFGDNIIAVLPDVLASAVGAGIQSPGGGDGSTEANPNHPSTGGTSKPSDSSQEGSGPFGLPTLSELFGLGQGGGTDTIDGGPLPVATPGGMRPGMSNARYLVDPNETDGGGGIETVVVTASRLDWFQRVLYDIGGDTGLDIANGLESFGSTIVSDGSGIVQGVYGIGYDIGQDVRRAAEGRAPKAIPEAIDSAALSFARVFDRELLHNDIKGVYGDITAGLHAAEANGTVPQYIGSALGNGVVLAATVATGTEELEGGGAATAANDLRNANSATRTFEAAATETTTYPEGLAFRRDLPEHLAGPDGFTRSGQLSGTHNQLNAVTALDGRGAIYTLSPTDTFGISELRYSYTNASGRQILGAKTVYDPAIYSDQVMLDISQDAGQRAFEMHLQDTTQLRFDLNQNGVNVRAYINFDPATGAPYVGNVHPIK
ncbi:MAG: LysM peptidoglycan-binding domain-containing protein [Rhizomicrobium sp.]